MNILERVAHRVFCFTLAEVCRREHLDQKSVGLNERIIEYSFALQCIHRTSARTVLDVGSGQSSWPSLLRTCGCIVTAIDEVKGYWRKTTLFNRHFYIIKDDITKPKLSGAFDLITCISTLEHIPNHQDAIRGMFSLLKPFPYNELHYVKNVYKLPGAGYSQNAPYICQVFSRGEVNQWLADNPGKILEQEYWGMFNGEFWTFGGRCQPRKVAVTDRHHHINILIQKV